MTDSHLNPDLLLDTVHSRAMFTAADESHLAACAECRAEWALVRATVRLGAGHFAALDAPRLVGAVQARLDATRRRSRQRWQWPLAFAAAAALFLAVLLPAPGPVTEAPSPAIAPAGSVLHELDSLSAVQLELVLAAMPSRVEPESYIEAVSLSDLSTNDLERVLRSMEEP